MEVGDVRFYIERLKALEEISTKEHRALTMEENWQKLNALYGLGKALGWKEDDSDLEIVRARWVKLKKLYESGAKPTAFVHQKTDHLNGWLEYLKRKRERGEKAREEEEKEF